MAEDPLLTPPSWTPGWDLHWAPGQERQPGGPAQLPGPSSEAGHLLSIPGVLVAPSFEARVSGCGCQCTCTGCCDGSATGQGASHVVEARLSLQQLQPHPTLGSVLSQAPSQAGSHPLVRVSACPCFAAGTLRPQAGGWGVGSRGFSIHVMWNCLPGSCPSPTPQGPAQGTADPPKRWSHLEKDQRDPVAQLSGLPATATSCPRSEGSGQCWCPHLPSSKPRH